MAAFLRYALLFLVVAATFAPGIVPTHLRLDDWGYVTGCLFVRDGFSGHNLARAFSDFGHGGIWMPLTYLSYMLDISLWGGGWRIHHALNVILHATNALLVYRLILAFLQANITENGNSLPETPSFSHSFWGLSPETRGLSPTVVALIAALLWALHPLRAEAVSWVASRKEELWTLFGIAGLLTWIKFCQKGGFLRWTLTFLLFACSCLSKPSAVCLPILAVIVWRALGAGPKKRYGKITMIAATFPFLLLSLVTGLIAIYSQTHPTGMEVVEIADTTLAWRLLNAAVSLGLYVSHTFAPIGLHIDYRATPGACPRDAVLGLSALGGILLLLAFVLFMKPRANLRRLTFLAVTWAFVTVAPVLGLLGLTGDKAYADRYTYMPAVGLSLAVAGLLVGASRRWLAVCGAALVAEVLLALPVIRSYGTDTTAYARVLADDPDHWRALRTLGCDYCALRGRTDEGLAMLRRSLRLRPSKLTADSLAYVLACRGEKGDADEVRALGRIVAADPRRDPGGLMLDALGMVAFNAGDATNAVKYLSAALVAPRRSHGNVHAMLYLGKALGQVGRRQEALEVLDRLRGSANAEVRREASGAAAQLRSP